MSITITEEVLQLFKKHGHIEYGERCTQLSHSIQAGLIAKEKGYDEELVLAAFLHDIGHLYPLEQVEKDFEQMGNFGIEAHDLWGEQFLQTRGFSERIIATVKNHVAAKRYLCFADANYYEQLSVASKATLAYQGGPMESVEAQAFESDVFFEDSLKIRRVDEAAKALDFEVMFSHWAYLENLLNAHLKIQY